MKPPTGRESFYQVISAAVADLTEHGFVSQERLDEWLRRIEIAARASLVPQSVLQNALRDTLSRVFERSTTNAALMKRHQGISQYTLQMIKPKLRAELDRRILASANLIKLNRETAIQQTLQRFAGWATSIPAGGSEVVDRKEETATVRRSIAGLSFEERRVVIDQGHKLSSAINEIVSRDGGAIAGRWRHVMESGSGYQPRPTHIARNNKVYLLRDSWAKQQGLVKPGPDGYADKITAPGEEVYCLPGDTKLDWFHDAEKAFRRWYDGPLVEIRTSSARVFRATPNHPVLTSKGWVPIGALNEGDYVVEVCGESVDASKLNANQATPAFSDFFDAVRSCGFGQEVRDGMRPDFHGDGCDSEIDIVSMDGPLFFDGTAALSEKGNEFTLASSDIPDARIGPFEKDGKGSLSAPHRAAARLANAMRDCVIGNGKLAGQIRGALSRLIPTAQLVGIEGGHFLPMTESLSKIDESGIASLFQSRAANTEDRSDLVNRLPFTAKTSDLVSVNRYRFRGHVFNLQTESGWYVGNSIVTHNCRCTMVYLYNLRDLPVELLTQKGRDELTRVREQIARMS